MKMSAAATAANHLCLCKQRDYLPAEVDAVAEQLLKSMAIDSDKIDAPHIGGKLPAWSAGNMMKAIGRQAFETLANERGGDIVSIHMHLI